MFRASAAVIVRIPYLHNYKDPDFLCKSSRTSFNETRPGVLIKWSTDATADISIWSNVEAGLGITAGSLVTIRPLFRWFRGDSYGGHSYGASQSGRKTTGTFPLSSMDARIDPNSSRYWRSDLVPENHRTMTTTQAQNGSRHSSQESLNPKQGSYPGVSIQKSFHVSTEEAWFRITIYNMGLDGILIK